MTKYISYKTWVKKENLRRFLRNPIKFAKLRYKWNKLYKQKLKDLNANK
jgi:hypothetical protein